MRMASPGHHMGHCKVKSSFCCLQQGVVGPAIGAAAGLTMMLKLTEMYPLVIREEEEEKRHPKNLTAHAANKLPPKKQ